jgi:hypothetical protein
MLFFGAHLGLALLFRDLSIDHAASSMEDCAAYYRFAEQQHRVGYRLIKRRLTFEIPSPFFEVIFGTQVFNPRPFYYGASI